ncbi:MAG TPA: AMP-binding protein, partial [Treponemataceae bacterium]|nr:AMP-binding protein [Treponemataceae bacterium]
MVTISDLGAYTFPAMLENTLKKFSDRPALGFASGEPITYAEFGKRISSLKDLLYRIGVEKGDRVALFSTSAPNWGVACFATVTLGAISVPLLPDFNVKEVQTCLEHSGAKVLIASKKLLEKIPDPASLGIKHVITISDLSLISGKEVRTGSAPEVTISEEDTASIIYTSGTTGRSKGVELSHRNFIFTAIGSQSFQRVNKYDVALSFLPLSHVYEFTIGFLLFVLNGSCVYYLEKPPTVTTLLPAMLKVRPTLMLSVPIIMEKIYKNKIVPTFTTKESITKLYAKPFFRKIFHRIAGKSLKKTFGGRLKFFGIGGSKVDPVVEQFLKEAHFPYAIGYGLTETAPLLAGSGPKITVPGTVGPKMPGVELKILDPDPETGIGELVAKGLNVMKGYYKDPEMTASVFTNDGWFRTGDLGEIDKKGRLSLKGRSKNLILNAAGENIYPEDIEFVLNQHPFVTDSLVVEGDNASLVALVQIDEEKIKAEAEKRASPTMIEHASRMKDQMGEAVSSAASGMSQAFVYKKEEILNEIKFFVNDNV